MRVLVTGGAGFVGSHVVDALLDAGHDVSVLDSLDPAAHEGAPDYLDPRARYVWGSTTDEAAWTEAIAGVDAVCHQAAKVGLGVDFGDARAYVEANDLGTVIGLSVLHGQRFAGRIVLASSMAVYGEGRYRCPTDGDVRPGPRRPEDIEAGRFEPPCPCCGAPLDPVALDETAPPSPRNVYAATKLHQEHLCAAFGREHDVPVCALRYHNIYGPRMPRDTPYAGVASIFRSRLAEGLPPLVIEDGEQRRDFVHVRDVARANVLALTAIEPLDGAYNIASGVPHSVGEMATALADAFGPKAPRPQVVGGARPGDARHVFGAVDAAAHDLGFRAAITFEAGMREFATAAQRHPVGRRAPGER